MKARICMLHNVCVWRGGAELILFTLSKELQRIGYEVDTFVFQYDREKCFPELAQGLNITATQKLFKSRSFKMLPALQALELALSLSGDYDIIHAHNFPANLAAFFAKKCKKKLFSRPYVWQCNEPPRFLYDRVVKEMRREEAKQLGNLREASEVLGLQFRETTSKFLDRIAARGASVIVTLSAFVSEWVREVYHRDPLVVHPGIDLERFRPISNSESFRDAFAKRNEAVLLTVSRLWPSKNLETTLRAFQIATKRIPDMRYVIVGDGPSKPFLVRQAQELGIEDRVLFVGDVPHNNLREYYGSCDVFLFPALGEPWGLTPLEAMACEKPVIAAAEGGPVEFVEDGVNGYLVEAVNPQAYARRITSLISDRDLMVSMGKAALRKAETFTWPQMAQRFSDVYQAMLSAV